MLMTSIFAFGIPPMYLYAVARMGGAFVLCAKFRIALLRLLFLIYCEIKETLLVFSLLNSAQLFSKMLAASLACEHPIVYFEMCHWKFSVTARGAVVLLSGLEF